MLVLSRKRGEQIMFGDDITVTILEIRSDKVRLGIQAPTDVPVHRREVYEAIQRENRSGQGSDQAANTNDSAAGAET